MLCMAINRLAPEIPMLGLCHSVQGTAEQLAKDLNENISEIINQMPIGSVSSIAHLGTSIVATSEDIESIIVNLEKYVEVRQY